MENRMIYEKYSADQQYRYRVYEKANAIYEVRAQRRFAEECMGEDWFDYCDIHQWKHLADSLERAIEIGDEWLNPSYHSF